MSDFRKFSIAIIVGWSLLLLLRRAVGPVGLMTLDEMARNSVAALVFAFCIVALFGGRRS